MEASFLTPHQLADRWRLNVKTLNQWRRNGQGPCYAKVSRHIVYWIHDIEDYEASKRYRSTSEYQKSKRLDQLNKSKYELPLSNSRGKK